MTNLNNELIVAARDSGLEENKVDGLLARFGSSFNEAKTILENAKDVKVTDETQKAEMTKAGEFRRSLKNVRVAVEHTRKELKEQSLREGKAIDGMANIIKAMIVPAEQYLETQEKYAENIAKERKAKQDAERRAIILEYTDIPERYNYGAMEETDFKKLIADLKVEKQLKIDADKKAEADRIAQEKAAEIERTKMAAENAKLKADAEAREKELAEERKAREAAEKVEADRKAAEAAKAAEETENQRKSLLAPDKEKLLGFADTLDTLELPKVTSQEAEKLINETKDFLSRVTKNLRTKAQDL